MADVNPELLAQVREAISAAKENGYNFFGCSRAVAKLAGWTDEWIAADINACTGIGDYDENPDELIAAVAAVRAEQTA